MKSWKGPFSVPSVYIDLNHIIEFAKSAKRAAPSNYHSLLDLVSNKQIVVPASSMLFMEIFNIGNRDKRLDLLPVIFSLCRRLVIVDFDRTLYREVHNAVVTQFGAGDCYPLPLCLFDYGYIRAFGRYQIEATNVQEEDRELANEVMANVMDALETEAALELLSKAIDMYKKTIATLPHQNLVAATARIRHVSRDVPFITLRSEYLNSMRSSIIEHFDKAVSSLEILQNGIHPVMPDRFGTENFLQQLPSLDVYANLVLQCYHRDRTSKVEVNDLYDFQHLSVAVPYCDVVVCDKKMKANIINSNLNEKYNTGVFSKPSDALEFLHSVL